MRRRSFLKKSALASTSLWMPAFLHRFNNPGQNSSRSGKILVVIQLSGGNDGLNTIVPFRNDLYYKNRPNLAVLKEKVLPLDDELGLNPVMTDLRALYDEGLLTIINSVGYPNPDRSHFRSMDIWHTGSGSDRNWTTGWLGRYMDNACNGSPAPYHALELDDSLSLALKGKKRNGFAMSNPAQLKRNTNNPFLKAIGNHHHHHEEETVAYLYKTMIDTQSSADYLFEQSKVYRSAITYPNTPFGKDLKQIAELITADTDTTIYYLTLSGFDTHANQKGQQERLLKQYSEGIRSFVKDLKQNNLMKDTLIMTFSEFGRRVKENASRGTDHGTANNLFFIGESLKKTGSFNAAPNLHDLEEGDLKYQVDFRRIYATVLDKWIGTNAESILEGHFSPLPLL